MDQEERNKYYLEILPEGERPVWPRPEDQLIVGSQALDSGYTQHWAYHLDSGKATEDLPPAEVLAAENPAPRPAILVDQPLPDLKGEDTESLELVLVKGGHAWAHTTSSLKNLDDNINSLLEVAKKKFKLEVEHFMTTDRVSESVERRLDEMEATEVAEAEDSGPAGQPRLDRGQQASPVRIGVEKKDSSAPPSVADLAETTVSDGSLGSESTADTQNEEASLESADKTLIRHVQNSTQGSDLPRVRTEGSAPIGSGSTLSQVRGAEYRIGPQSSSKKWILIPVVVLLLGVGGVILLKDTILEVLSGASLPAMTQSALTPTPPSASGGLTVTPTPEVKIDRSEFKVRVLNGTTKSGAARELSEGLKEKGWEIIKVGNNANQEVAKGYIRVKEGKNEARGTLISDLEGEYEASGSALRSADDADLEVVIGDSNR